MEARIGRAVYYELVALAVPELVGGRQMLGVWSCRRFFPLGEMPRGVLTTAARTDWRSRICARGSEPRSPPAIDVPAEAIAAPARDDLLDQAPEKLVRAAVLVPILPAPRPACC